MASNNAEDFNDLFDFDGFGSDQDVPLIADNHLFYGGPDLFAQQPNESLANADSTSQNAQEPTARPLPDDSYVTPGSDPFQGIDFSSNELYDFNGLTMPSFGSRPEGNPFDPNFAPVATPTNVPTLSLQAVQYVLNDPQFALANAQYAPANAQYAPVMPLPQQFGHWQMPNTRPFPTPQTRFQSAAENHFWPSTADVRSSGFGLGQPSQVRDHLRQQEMLSDEAHQTLHNAEPAGGQTFNAQQPTHTESLISHETNEPLEDDDSSEHDDLSEDDEPSEDDEEPFEDGEAATLVHQSTDGEPSRKTLAKCVAHSNNHANQSAIGSSTQSSSQTPLPGLAFASLRGAETAMATRFLENDWTPPTDDESIPSTSVEQSEYVLLMLNALKDPSNCKDNKKGYSYVKRWTGTGYYDIQEMEKVCWQMLEVAERLHAEGPRSLNFYCEEALKKVKASRNLTFEQRIDAVCAVLRFSKNQCDKLMKNEGIEALVGAPVQKMSGAQTMVSQNKKRQKWILKGRKDDPHHGTPNNGDVPELPQQSTSDPTQKKPKKKQKRSSKAAVSKSKAKARSTSKPTPVSTTEAEDTSHNAREQSGIEPPPNHGSVSGVDGSKQIPIPRASIAAASGRFRHSIHQVLQPGRVSPASQDNVNTKPTTKADTKSTTNVQPPKRKIDLVESDSSEVQSAVSIKRQRTDHATMSSGNIESENEATSPPTLDIRQLVTSAITKAMELNSTSFVNKISQAVDLAFLLSEPQADLESADLVKKSVSLVKTISQALKLKFPKVSHVELDSVDLVETIPLRVEVALSKLQIELDSAALIGTITRHVELAISNLQDKVQRRELQEKRSAQPPNVKPSKRKIDLVESDSNEGQPAVSAKRQRTEQTEQIDSEDSEDAGAENNDPDDSDDAGKDNESEDDDPDDVEDAGTEDDDSDDSEDAGATADSEISESEDDDSDDDEDSDDDYMPPSSSSRKRKTPGAADRGSSPTPPKPATKPSGAKKAVPPSAPRKPVAKSSVTKKAVPPSAPQKKRKARAQDLNTDYKPPRAKRTSS